VTTAQILGAHTARSPFGHPSSATVTADAAIVTLAAMTQWSDLPDDGNERELDEAVPVAPAGGGMLRQVLDHVIEVRDGAAADRTALAHAITTSFTTFGHQLSALAAALDAVNQRAEHDDQTARARADKQAEAITVDIAALRAEIDGVTKTMTNATNHIVTELRQLRTALLGPN
jgi:DNA anti-recombination protein RmuC